MKKLLFTLFVLLSSFAFGQESQSHNKPLEDLDVNFMLRGYFFAGSRIADRQALGGFGTSGNFPRPIEPNMNFRRGEISLVAIPDEEVVFARKFKGMKVLLVNGTQAQVAFSASDSRLYIVQEARDRRGKWRPIEYLPSSWCGNSYHQVFLGAHEYWEFAAARYTGRYKTKLRFRLTEYEGKTERLRVLSNEFEGSVNDKQFTIQQGHTPADIMDPYNN
jgi:hypothetical protein